MRSMPSLAAVAVSVAVVLTTAACKSATEVTSPWPVADAERAVPRPPVPPRWPLTGLDAPTGDAIRLRPVSVKVENSPEARPQSGLDRADVVYESLAEGGITRFNAIYQSQAPGSVGPVRSARLSDVHIVPQYDALFAFSGASGVVTSRLAAARVPNLSEDAGVTKCYTRVSDRRRPHNLYLDIAKAREVAAERGFETVASLRPLQFDRSAPPTGTSVTGITVPFSPSNRTSWRYDPATRRYLRSDNGRPNSDAVTGEQLAARNVVVIWARTTETASRDVVGSPTLDITLSGTGRATVFHDGQRFDGTWSAQKGSPPQFVGGDGRAIGLAPGNTWMQVIPNNANISME